MSYRRGGLAAFFLGLAITPAFTGLAQAEGSWRIEGESVTKPKEVATTVTGDIRLEVPEGGKVYFALCKEIVLDAVSLLPEGSSSGQMLLCECGVYTSKEVLFCIAEVTSPKFIGDLFLHEKRSFVLVAPETGTTLFTIKPSKGEEECIIETPITGSFVLEDVTSENGSWSDEAVEHKAEVASTAQFPEDVLHYGTGGPEVGFVAPSVQFSLTGADSERAWSGLG